MMIQLKINMKTQFAVFDKKFNIVILGMYDTKEEAQTDREKYGYNTEDYYVANIEEYMNNLIKRTKKVPYHDYASYTQIPESIAKQPLDPNADYSQRTELGDLALELTKKVFDELKNKN